MAQHKTKQQVIDSLQQANTVLIDIRTPEEFLQQHIPGAQNIEAGTLSHHLSQLQQYNTIICICNHGHKRSQSAADTLSAAGLENVYYLEGGVGGWINQA